MKGNKKRFLALGMAILMAGSPVTYLKAEERENVEIVEQAAVPGPGEMVVEETADVEAEETVQEEIVQGEIVQEETAKESEPVETESEGQPAEIEEDVVETVEGMENVEVLSMEIGDTTYEDGDYDIAIESGFKMFKIVSSKAVLSGDKLTVSITTGSTTYDKIYLGSKDDEVKEPVYQGTLLDDGSGYSISFDLTAEDMGKEINFVPGKPDGTWYVKNQYTLTIPSTIEKIEPTEPEEPIVPEDPAKEVEDGDYNVEVESSAAMFKVVHCVLTKQDGQMCAVITLSGTGYDYLYMGTVEEAAAASEEAWIKYVENEEGKYTYTIPVTALDTPIAVAAHSIKNDKWYDRTLTFKSEGMEKIDSETTDPDPENPDQPGNNDDSHAGGNTDINIPDHESNHVADLNGGTVRVNSSTILKDGIYTPDQFSWSGGTGRVAISCTKITVKSGQAYATLVFSSGSYSYIKANGNIYYGTNTGRTSTFVIPVALNRNNTIIGMTTAMSTTHEIRYNIFIYLAEAEGGEQATALDSQKLDEQAPVIAGLTYEEEIEMEYTEYVKLYRYENDILLLEIDMKTDTDRELTEEEPENLYEGNVVKYLIISEDTEIPVGIEKNVVIIQKPVEMAYVAEQEVFSLLKEIEVEEERLMESGEEVDYKEIVKNKCNLAILSSDLLEEEDDEQLLEFSERFATLKIPMFVDRMKDETKEEAKLEWLKVYGAFFDCEEKANEIYETKLAEGKAE